MKVACVEKRATLGGTCLNVGCIPSKALLQASEKFHEAGHGLAAFGVKVGKVELDLAAMMAHKDKVVDANVKGVEFLFRKNKVEWVKGAARIADALYRGLAVSGVLALIAFWFKWLGDGMIARDWPRVRLAVLALAASAVATWWLTIVSGRVQRRFRDKVTIALESHIATLLASITTIAHQERPEYLDRLAVLRNQVFVLDHMYMSLFATCAWILRLAVTVALLMSVHPVLALLVFAALPTPMARVSYLLLFGLGSTLSMAAMSGLLGWPLARLGSNQALTRTVSIVVGLATMVLGVLWGYEPLFALIAR